MATATSTHRTRRDPRGSLQFKHPTLYIQDSNTMKIHVADLFCGAGGTSTGLLHACDELGLDPTLVAINHWDEAIATHQYNHPTAQHLCANLDNVDPVKVVPGRHLHLLVASPECTHHSRARGGRPMSDQSRASVWHIMRWVEVLRVDHLLIENISEFLSFGPLNANGRPITKKKGQGFLAFIHALEAMNYRVEWRITNCANFGDPTSRERLFIQARRGNGAITWPEPTHSATGNPDLFGGLQKWRGARDIIDWSIPSQSIFTRKNPLRPKTLARIEAGLKKFGGAHADPFLVILRRHQNGRAITDPLPTLTAAGTHIGLCEPTYYPAYTDEQQGQTIPPFIVPQSSIIAPRELDQPLSTITTTSRGIGLVEPFLLPHRVFQQMDVDSIDRPMRTLIGKNAGDVALVEPFLIQFNRNAEPRRLQDPLPALTTRNHMALIVVNGNPYYCDIRFRMLTRRELSLAMGFPDTYHFTGTKEAQTRMIGNAVPCATAKALCLTILKRYAQQRRPHPRSQLHAA